MEKLGNRSNLTGVRRRTVETYAKEAEKRGDDKSPLGRLKRHPAPAYCTVLYCTVWTPPAPVDTCSGQLL